MYKPLSPTYVGLELEYENVGNRRSSELLEMAGLETSFAAILDGSLRPRDHNTEFVFRGPILAPRVEGIVRRLCSEVLSLDKYTVSWRCSTHVHIDHRARYGIVPAEVVLACLLDRVWYAWDATGRQESKFCVPISQIWTSMLPPPRYRPRPRAPVRVPEPMDLENIFEQGRRPRGFNELGLRVEEEIMVPRAGKVGVLIGHKYTGLNISRARPDDIGTVEYRYAAGTTDPERILEYISMCLWCADFAQIFGTPEEIIKSFIKARTFDRWVEEHADERVKPSFLVGARGAMGASGPTALEIEAAVMLANAA